MFMTTRLSGKTVHLVALPILCKKDIHFNGHTLRFRTFIQFDTMKMLVSKLKILQYFGLQAEGKTS